jgi:hypothetical protein
MLPNLKVNRQQRITRLEGGPLVPAAINEVVIDEVRREWALDPETSGWGMVRKFHRKYGPNLVGSRTIRATTADAKKSSPVEPFPSELWQPWTDSAKNLDDNIFASKVHQYKRSAQGVGLTRPEAEWATRLRVALKGLEIVQVLELVRAFVARERVAHYLQKPASTEDLTGFVVSQMWVDKEHQLQYEDAIASKAVPLPFLNASEEFLKELFAQGPSGLGADTWDHLNRHPLFECAFLILANVPLNPGWSRIFLEYLRDPARSDALPDPAIADTAEGVLV